MTTALKLVPAPKPRSYSVRVADGKYLGRYDVHGSLCPVHPSMADTFASESDAAAVAASHGGTVVPSPGWDAKAKRYVEGA